MKIDQVQTTFLNHLQTFTMVWEKKYNLCEPLRSQYDVCHHDWLWSCHTPITSHHLPTIDKNDDNQINH